MPNKTYAREWVEFAYKNLVTAKILLEVDHYEDIIGVNLQQALEKFLKSVMAYENKKIPKEHDLVKLYFIIENWIELEENEIILLRIATNYYKDDRYPNPNYELPSREEIKDVLTFTEHIFARVCEIFDMEMSDIVDER